MREEGFEGGIDNAFCDDECKRAPELVDAMDMSDDSAEVREKRSRVGDPHLAVAADKEVVKARAHWWDPRMPGNWNAADASPLEGGGATISAWRAD